MQLVDTHAHLCASEFGHDLDAVLERAARSGVGRIVAVGEDLADARRNLDLAAEYPLLVAPAAGLFPTNLEVADADALLAFIRANARSWVAIGEVGLDYWKVKDEAGREIQRAILERFVSLAEELGLPLNVHSRSAGHHAIEFLLQQGARRVQMHAFDGRASRALAGVEAGYFFSIPPSIVRSPQKQKLARQLPLSCLLVETDSPVLGPDPARRNEPANVSVALEAIAEIKGLPAEAVAEALAQNTLRLYGDAIRGQETPP